MTTLYFIRHAEPNYENHDDKSRELTAKGLEDRKLVTEYLKDKDIDVVLSSPYKRSVDTVKHFADQNGLSIQKIDDFRERKITDAWIGNFQDFCRKQWEDFSYKLADGESLKEVQDRNIRALNAVLETYKDKNIVVGSHGTALGTIINYFDPSFDYDRYMPTQTMMPWIVKFVFSDRGVEKIEEIDPFTM